MFCCKNSNEIIGTRTYFPKQVTKKDALLGQSGILHASILAKKALLAPLSHKNPVLEYAALEQNILKSVNRTGIGVQGMGGKNTALAVHILTAPCHIASLPVAVNLQCHSHRHTTIII